MDSLNVKPDISSDFCSISHLTSAVCPDVFNVLLCSYSVSWLVFNQRAREHLNFSGMQLRVKLLFFFIPLTAFKSFNILSPLNNQESEIGFVPPGVLKLKRWRTSLVQITAAYCT